MFAALKLHYPPKTVCVCSFHLIENKARKLLSDPVVCYWADANHLQTERYSVCIMFSGLHIINLESFRRRIMKNRMILFDDSSLILIKDDFSTY